MKIAIIDYGVGNLRSVEKGLAYVGMPGRSRTIPGIDSADAIVLPGVGAFETGMRHVAPLQKVVVERIAAGVPFLGICLGMQMLYEASEEGGLHEGLGIVPGRVTRFDGSSQGAAHGLELADVRQEHPLLKDIPGARTSISSTPIRPA